MHADIWGIREKKYDNLLKNNLKTIIFNELNITPPYYFFIDKDSSVKTEQEYQSGFYIADLFQNL